MGVVNVNVNCDPNPGKLPSNAPPIAIEQDETAEEEIKVVEPDVEETLVEEKKAWFIIVPLMVVGMLLLMYSLQMLISCCALMAISSMKTSS